MRCARCAPRAEMQAALAELNADVRAPTTASRLRTTSASTPARSWPATPAPGQRLVTGDTVNVAARLEQAAGAGRDPARRADLPARPRRGRGGGGRAARRSRASPSRCPPIGCWRCGRDRARPAAAGYADGRAASSEMAALQAHAERAVDERACRMATVVGDAGVGKSRLVTRVHVRQATARRRLIRGRCLPYGDGITFWPLRRDRARRLRHPGRMTPPMWSTRSWPSSSDAGRRRAPGLGDRGHRKQLSRCPRLFWAARRFLEVLGRQAAACWRHRRHPLGGADLPGAPRVTWSRRVTGASVLLLCTSRHELIERRPSGRLTRTPSGSCSNR